MPPPSMEAKSAHAAAHALAAHAAHLLHHVRHLPVHLQKLVDVGDLDAGAGGDALPARAVDEIGLGAFLLGHRGDDRFLARQHRVVHAGGGELILDLADAGQHAEHALHAAELLHLLQLLGEIVHVELALLHLAGELLGLFLVEGLGRLLDQRHDIAHVEDAVGDTLGMEGFQRIELFADAEELDRRAGDRAHRKRRAAARIAIGARQDDAGQLDALVEGFGDVDRVLAGQAVGDEDGLVRLDLIAHGGDFGHQLFVDVLAAGGVEDDDVIAADLGARHGAPGDIDRALAGDDRQRRHLGLLAQDLELLHGGGAVDVERGHQHPLLLSRLQQQAELGRGGGLARALQADHQDRRGRASPDRGRHCRCPASRPARHGRS